jgi:hypothetical protein
VPRTYTELDGVSVGDPFTLAMWETYRENMNNLMCPASCSLASKLRNPDFTEFAIASASFEAIPWQYISHDNDGMAELDDTFAGTPVTYRITIRTPGIYIITATTKFEAATGGGRYLSLRLNGSTHIALRGGHPSGYAGDGGHVAVEALYAFDADDYIEVFGYQTSGSFLSVATDTTYLGACWLGKTSF